MNGFVENVRVWLVSKIFQPAADFIYEHTGVGIYKIALGFALTNTLITFAQFARDSQSYTSVWLSMDAASFAMAMAGDLMTFFYLVRFPPKLIKALRSESRGVMYKLPEISIWLRVFLPFDALFLVVTVVLFCLVWWIQQKYHVKGVSVGADDVLNLAWNITSTCTTGFAVCRPKPPQTRRRQSKSWSMGWNASKQAQAE